MWSCLSLSLSPAFVVTQKKKYFGEDPPPPKPNLLNLIISMRWQLALIAGVVGFILGHSHVLQFLYDSFLDIPSMYHKVPTPCPPSQINAHHFSHLILLVFVAIAHQKGTLLLAFAVLSLAYWVFILIPVRRLALRADMNYSQTQYKRSARELLRRRGSF